MKYTIIYSDFSMNCPLINSPRGWISPMQTSGLDSGEPAQCTPKCTGRGLLPDSNTHTWMGEIHPHIYTHEYHLYHKFHMKHEKVLLKQTLVNPQVAKL
jgi:hypothetical protein